MITPPASVRNPFARCDGSWDFKGQSDLHDTKAQQDHTDGTDQPKDKFGQVIDHGQRIIRCNTVVAPAVIISTSAA